MRGLVEKETKIEKAELRYRGRNGSFGPKLDRLGTDLSGEDLHIDGTRMEKNA